jgi:hypothetical protein
LLDANGLPAMVNDRAVNRFIANTDRNSFNPPRSRRAWRANGERMFPFAQDNYVLVIPHGDLTGYSVLVEDERREGDRPRYLPTLVPLSPQDSYPLCGRYDDAIYPAMEGRPLYAPVEIELRSP